MTSKSSKLPISALVVCFNEGHMLGNCLASIQFCQEIVVVDLGSSDNSVEIAKEWGAEVWNCERIPVVEIVHNKVIDYLKHEWVLLTDPDEVTSIPLAAEVARKLDTFTDSSIGLINAPCVYYYKKKRLKGTRWGGNQKVRPYLLHRQRVLVSNNVHRGKQLKIGFSAYNFPYRDNTFVKHYWMNGFLQLLEKHKRYLKEEGKSKYEAGERTGLGTIVQSPLKSFYDCFYVREGYLDKEIGLLLSLFWAWYSFNSQISLYKYQARKK